MLPRWFRKPKQKVKWRHVYDAHWRPLIRQKYEMLKAINRGDSNAAYHAARAAAHAVRAIERHAVPERFRIETEERLMAQPNPNPQPMPPYGPLIPGGGGPGVPPPP